MLRKAMIGAALVLPLSLGLSACDEQGPAEKAGEKLDDAAQSMKDAVDPPGPGERLGRDIDEAAGN